mgnify:FL=1
MKKLTLTFALILSTLMSFSQTKDSQGHTLVNLWKTYYKAESADKPQDQIKALEAIKQEASSRHLAWDFYDAAGKYVSVRTSVNWKERSALYAAFDREVSDFGEPVAVFYHFHGSWNNEKTASYVRDNMEALQKASNPEFYTRDGNLGRPVYSDALIPLVNNDYEYALWSIFLGDGISDVKGYYGDTYPFCAFVEYTEATKSYSAAVSYTKLAPFVEKYDGKAAALLGRQDRLRREFSLLEMDKGSTSAQYSELRALCGRFEKDRAAFKGGEKAIADCCTRVADLIKTLDGKDIDARVDDGVLNLSLRNVSSLTVTVRSSDGKKVWTKKVTNGAASYYVRDHVSVKLPDFDDGNYTVDCDGEDANTYTRYDKYTLAMSVRAIAEGYGAYVAEFDTGKPLSRCDFILSDADGAEIIREKGVVLDGFTTLPGRLQNYFTKDSYKNYRLRATCTDASGRLRLSEEISTRSPHPGKVREYKNDPVKRILILSDRGAYNPGETIFFKAVLYKGTYEYELMPEGTEVKVELLDTQRNTVASSTLRTNGFGSVAGSFELKDFSRGGFYTIKASCGGTSEARQVRVDEFVLPTFELTWDKDDTMYFAGDEICVSGKVSSYSGHNIGSARARMEIRNVGVRDVEIAPDGRFSESFVYPDSAYDSVIPVTVTITDDTGETLSFTTVKQVNYSIPLAAMLCNKVNGHYDTTPGVKSYYSGNDWIIRDDFARVKFNTSGFTREGLKIWYDVTDENGKSVAAGNAGPGETLDISLQGRPSGLYKLNVHASAPWKGKGLKDKSVSYSFVMARDTDTALDMDAVSFFKNLGDDDIAVQIGSTFGPVWAAVELLGSGNVLLEHRIVYLKGERGKAGSLETVSYERKPSYPETLTLKVLFFRNGQSYDYERRIKLPFLESSLPFEFTRFTEIAAPGEKVSLQVRTLPGVECAATVFDKATETIFTNNWSMVYPVRKPESVVYYSTVCGRNGSYWEDMIMYDSVVMGGRAKNGVLESRAPKVADSAMVAEEESVEADDGADAPQGNVSVRENFAATMAWEPFLLSDKEGLIDFSFDGADRLSTYYVQMFAHTEGMKNAAVRREMKVTIPVKAALVQPLFLYGGDEYTARVSLASSMEVPVSGRVSVRFLDGDDYRTAPVLATKSAHVTIPAGSTVAFSAPYDVPAEVGTLGILVNFVADDASYGSDALFVTVPVKAALQTLTEAHSAVLLAGQDREALIARLRSQFVNADASALVPVERDILGMIKDAIPDTVEPRSSNVLSLTEAYYTNVIARSIGAPGLDSERMSSIMEKISACQNTGGGIAWFEGMEASPIVTAAILQRIASMPGEDTGSLDVEAAVKYLDGAYFGKAGQPWWCGSISLEYYLQTRALFPEVPFSSPGGKELRQFKKDVKAYLVPSRARGLNGQILAKARRLRTLQSLVLLPGGTDLAKSWGLRLRSATLKSLNADVESLLQYAVPHASGGIYYPNAVMPWRGLLESELYAHSLLCDLFTDASLWKPDGKLLSYASEAGSTAEGIRIWIMIQKETQQWADDAAYIEAIASVLRGTPETLATRVILLSTTFTKPFPEVKAAGNGFTVKREFFLDDKILSDGDPVRVGDRITARYSIWNEENRSFVRLSAPRPASMRPVAQLSGHYGWWLRPMSYGLWNFSPQGYRNVLSDKTEYWFDSYPEENTAITEEFFVTQEGTFQMPAVEIESLYAPHYRANDDGRGPLVSK